MTPKEKAEQLFGKFYELPVNHATAKDSALIAVDEIIDYLISNRITGTLTIYWKEVKKEIIKL
jgi:hypothetical protein